MTSDLTQTSSTSSLCPRWMRVSHRVSNGGEPEAKTECANPSVSYHSEWDARRKQKHVRVWAGV